MRTLAGQTSVEGRGLFTSAPVRATFRPGTPGSGNIFVTPDGDRVPASIDHLCDTPIHPAFATLSARNTNLSNTATPEVITTEHSLAALAGLGLTDIEIELSAPELPIGDGSALPFTDALTALPTVPAITRDPIVVHEPITIETDGARITCEPADRAELTYVLDYADQHPIPTMLTRQSATWTAGDSDSFLADVAPARTFSLKREAEQLQALGMFQGFTPRDLLVLAPDGPIDNTLRFENEPARHKLLDLIGDLALVGRPVRARITAERTGHAANHALARALAQLR